MRIDFIIGGVQKGGTTALADFVGQHPEIGFSNVKEPHYFDRDELWSRRSDDHASYHQHWDWQAPVQVRGEATPISTYWHEVPERIHSYSPKMKWIVLLRHPTERAYSHWAMEKGRDLESFTFEEAIAAEAQRLAHSPGRQHRVWSYADRGRYSVQLQRLFDLFGRERVLVLRHERLKAQHDETLERVWRFLGVGDHEVAPREVFAQRYAPMGAQIRTWLDRKFEPEIRALEELLDEDFSAWRARSEVVS